MSTTTEQAVHHIPTSAPAPHERRRTFANSAVGGAGGLIFVALVIVQNVLRSTAPALDAAPAKVVEYYAGHRTISAVLMVTFVVSGAGLAAFAGTLVSRLARGRHPGAAGAGALGVAGVVCLFSTTVACDLALSASIHHGIRAADTIGALWTLHGAVFSVLPGVIAIATRL